MAKEVKRGNYFESTVEVIFNGKKVRVSKDNAWIYESKHKAPKGVKVPKGFKPYDKREEK